MNQIEQVLSKLFEKYRLVFWYDEATELTTVYNALTLDGIEKITIANNEFGVKYRLLREEPQKKFLLYRAGPRPEPLDNWLLDLELAHQAFYADQFSIWLRELGLRLEHKDELRPHLPFFQATQRREDLQGLLTPPEGTREVQLKMAAVCVRSAPRLDEIIKSLLAELADGRADKFDLLKRCNLDTFLWSRMKILYGYDVESPSIKDFLLTLMHGAFRRDVFGEAFALSNDAVALLNQWQDSASHQAAFETLSAQSADELQIKQALEALEDYRALAKVDYFELIDKKILSHLAHEVTKRTIPVRAVEKIVRQRAQTYWCEAHYKHHYEALQTAAQLMDLIEQSDLNVYSLAHGVQQYTAKWYQLDQLYRHCLYHIRQAGEMGLLSDLQKQIDNLYVIKFQTPLNVNWQALIERTEKWEIENVMSQAAFYERQVERPFINQPQKKKIFVIISDALRYEVGEELLRLIRQEDRYEGEIIPALTMLPSFTKLGMAALLPHETLTITEKGTVEIEGGQSTSSTDNRSRILAARLDGRGLAVKATDMINNNTTQNRALVANQDVVYIYHNRIDETGDQRESEERVFEAVQDALEELVLLIKKLANANANNILITADHGFLYQNQKLVDSDFTLKTPQGIDMEEKSRRYVLGYGLEPSPSFNYFTAAQIGLSGEIEMLIPKATKRLRQQGTGSRYVHGGASLQEVVIPVLKINKKRESDISLVTVNISSSDSNLITTGQKTVIFYQTTAVSEKVQPRKLRAGIYNKDNELISDQHELMFDFTSEEVQQRELAVRFILTSKADDANGEAVYLRLEEQVLGTNHMREYKSAVYTLRRSFSSDFDF